MEPRDEAEHLHRPNVAETVEQSWWQFGRHRPATYGPSETTRQNRANSKRISQRDYVDKTVAQNNLV